VSEDDNGTARLRQFVGAVMSGVKQAAGGDTAALPFVGATEPHPDGLRITLGSLGKSGESGAVTFADFFFTLYPMPGAGARTQAEADAEAERVGGLVWAAATAAARQSAERVQRVAEAEAAADLKRDAWAVLLAETEDAEGRPLVGAGPAAGAALRAELERDGGPLTAEEFGAASTIAAYLSGYLAGAEIEAARAEQAEEKATTLDRVQRLPMPTAPWAGGLTTGYRDVAAGRYEVATLANGAGVVSAANPHGQLRFATKPSAAAVAATYPGMTEAEAHELAGALKKDGHLKGSLIALAAVQFTVLHPSELIEWDDRFRLTFGWKRPGSRPGQDRDTVLAESRRAFDRLLYSRLQMGANGEQVGRAFSHGEEAIGERELYRLGYRQRDAEGLPLRVRFDPVGVSLDMLRSPGRSESLGYLNAILALPETTPGRWATALIAFLSENWRRRVNKAGECWKVTREDGTGPGLSFGTVTRAYVFECVPPDPPQTPDELLGNTKNAGRAPAYFAAAVELLIDAKLIDACIAKPTRYAEKHGREPWPGTNADGTKRRAARDVDWRKSWRTQSLEIRPGGVLLGELLEQVQKRTRGLNHGAG
jgi:hypothetical protein